jgi:DNA primase
MPSSQPARQRIGDFYVETVLPALAARLDVAFPEFGWQQDARGWVATDEEMTHRVFGVRAARIVAHGPAPSGFLVHGGEPTLWTAYLNGGVVPRGETFGAVVKELAARAGVDVAPIERPQRPDRRSELLEDFFLLCQAELRGGCGEAARSYLERRGVPAKALAHENLGAVPNEVFTKNRLREAGYSELEIAQSGVLADGRWPGRVCGAWREPRGRIGTLWARSLRDSESPTRYLYLRGASRATLLPYGVSEVLRLPPTDRRELVLVEGLLDVHHLRARGFAPIAAIGGARLQPSVSPRLRRLGFDSIVLAFDNDAPGRDGVTRAVDAITRASNSPAVRLVESRNLGAAKDPDGFVREHGIAAFRVLVDKAECAIGWRARELLGDIGPENAPRERRAALARAGEWLGSLSRRYALEQEDAIVSIADRCGYSRQAVERAFRARFWRESADPNERRPLVIER